MTRGLRVSLFAAGLLALAGCMDDGRDYDARSAVTVTDDVWIAGPSGYCVDPSASKLAGSSAFVVMGSCAAIGNRPTLPQPDFPVVLTAAVTREGLAPASVLQAHFAAQGEDPDLGGYRVRQVVNTGGVLFLLIDDAAGHAAWRGLIGLGSDVTITLGARAPAGAEVPARARMAAMEAFAAQIRAANTGRGQPAPG